MLGAEEGMLILWVVVSLQVKFEQHGFTPLGGNNHRLVDSYDLLVIEYLVLLSLAFSRGVTGLIMRSVKLEPNRIFPDAYSAPRSAFAAMSHWTLVNSNGFF